MMKNIMMKNKQTYAAAIFNPTTPASFTQSIMYLYKTKGHIDKTINTTNLYEEKKKHIIIVFRDFSCR